MALYRLDYLDKNSKIVRTEDLEAADDIAAFETVGAMRAEADIEIWKNERYVAWIKRSSLPPNEPDLKTL